VELDGDPAKVIAELLAQNTSLRYEGAVLSANLKEIMKEIELVRQMEQSRNIPPDLLEMLSKLDIR
jgi:hypothetical protein